MIISADTGRIREVDEVGVDPAEEADVVGVAEGVKRDIEVGVGHIEEEGVQKDNLQTRTITNSNGSLVNKMGMLWIHTNSNKPLVLSSGISEEKNFTQMIN